MRTHYIELTDRTEDKILADHWTVENDEIMHFYQGDTVVYSKKWTDILFIYSHKEDNHDDI